MWKGLTPVYKITHYKYKSLPNKNGRLTCILCNSLLANVSEKLTTVGDLEHVGCS